MEEALEFLTFTMPFLVLFYLAALLFLRPTRTAWLASLLGGVVVGVFNIGFDILAYFLHWWHYTFTAANLHGTPVYLVPVIGLLNWGERALHINLPFYLSPILIYGSLAYLFIWRFWRGRQHWLAIFFLIGVPLFCIVRDVVGGVYNTSYQIWDNVPGAIVGTVMLWIVAFAAGLAVFWRLTPRRAEAADHTERAGRPLSASALDNKRHTPAQ
ncbi:MAG TPA: hypothetical protein VKX46_11705 [Ktedonobacteraceae bacterium]|nr:hypothetical protein [Ktedonobacteraceae bacterium]